MIIGMTTDAVIPQIQMVETSIEAWATLKGLYETNNKVRILLLQHQLHDLELDEGGSVHDYITKVKVVRDQLAAIGHRVDSSQVALMVFHRLPRSYHGFMTTLTASERTRPLTLNELAPLCYRRKLRKTSTTNQKRKP